MLETDALVARAKARNMLLYLSGTRAYFRVRANWFLLQSILWCRSTLPSASHECGNILGSEVRFIGASVRTLAVFPNDHLEALLRCFS